MGWAASFRAILFFRKGNFLKTDSSQLFLMTKANPYITDEELVAACLKGDEAAWEALLERYGRVLYTMALKSGLGPDDAADIFQMICFILVKNLPTLREPGKLHGWLITTAKRECWRLRRLRRIPVVALDELLEKGERLEPSGGRADLPEANLLLIEQQHKVREGIKTLGLKCQKLLWGLYYAPEPLSHQQLGRLLEVSSSSIGRLRARCLERLRAALCQMGFE